MTEAPTSATSTWISEPRQTLKRGRKVLQSLQSDCVEKGFGEVRP